MSLLPQNPELSGWAKLRSHTPARIGQPRTGAAVATAAQLDFQLAHARARDAVHAPFDAAALAAELTARGMDAICVASAAPNRTAYLTRPDLGRKLDESSRRALSSAPCDLAFVIADGLSAIAVHRHALRLIDAVRSLLADQDWRIGPVVVAERARVALGDEIGQALRTRMVAVMIGERPGLSAPDSLGVYLTWAPRAGRSDAERNCISNIRPEGLPYDKAAATLVYLLKEARARQATGIMLKEETGAALLK